ncbi:pyridoxamine 5'-phosphate oxidase family protein [Streptomyces sp. NPDC052225]|uniref:pyridoxamine 5'-phosphate oxidase family protein n=1 Tax=Streptomyces sp. NPDC052225 TaxID=3154949 RepID=UPI0034420589
MTTASEIRDADLLDRPLPRLPGNPDARARDLAERAVAAVAAQVLLTPKPGLADHTSDARGASLAAAAAPLYDAFHAAASSPGLSASQLAAVREEAGARLTDEEGLLGLAQALRALLPLVAARAGGADTVREVCARAEAASGLGTYALITDFALPALHEARALGHDEDTARLDALLALMARRQDPAVAASRGPLAVRMLRRDAASVLEAGGRGTEEGTQRFAVLEGTVRRYGITPADSAGLLAATLFLDALEATDTPDAAPAEPAAEHLERLTDLGRRIAAHRARLGLSLPDLARRTEASPSYLRYLETHPASPAPGFLTRLAAALETTAEELSGALTDVPPGLARERREPALVPLSESEARSLLASHGVGRLAFTAPDGPVVVPLNYRVTPDGGLAFRTRPGSVTNAAGGQRVAFEVDRIDDATSTGWSVLVVGTARAVADADTGAALDALPGTAPWAGRDRDRWFVVTPHRVSGRRITLSDEA